MTITVCMFLQLVETPLQTALRNGNEQLVEILIEAGADVNIVDYVSYMLSFTQCIIKYTSTNQELIIFTEQSV